MFAGIEAFVHVAELGSFRRAAARMGVTPAAISKAVAKLEADLGVRLLERTSRRVEPTAEGRLYLGHARAALDALLAGRDRVALARAAVEGPLRLSASPALGPAVARALPALLARHPRLRPELSVTDRVVRLAEEEVDVALRLGPVEDGELLARALRRPRWVLVAAPALLRRVGVPSDAAALDEWPRAAFVGPSGLEVPWALRGPAPTSAATFRTDDGGLLVEAALAGLAVAQVFEGMAAAALADGRLVEVLPGASAEGPPLHAVCLHRRRAAPKVRVALDWLEDVFGPGP